MNALAPVVGIVVRHGLTLAAGALASHGYISASATQQVIAGGMGLLGLFLSYMQKRRSGQFDA